MNAHVFVSLALLSALALAGSPAAAAPQKTRLVVKDLEAKGVPPAEASVLSGAVCRAFGARPRLNVLCGEDLRALLSLASLSASLDACDEAGCFSKVSEALDARYLVSGRISKADGRYVLALGLLDAKASAVVARTAIEGISLDQMEADAEEAAQELLRKLR